MSMSQNSIKILKNQSKWQKRKRFLILSLLVIAILLTFSFSLFYLMKDDSVSVHSENDVIKSHSIKDDIQDLQGVHLDSKSDQSENSIDQLFKIAQDKLSSKEDNSVLLNKQKIVEKDKTEPTNKKALAVEIPKKLPIQSEQVPTTIKNVPSTKAKSDASPAAQKRLDQPFKIDSMDAIILLELDVPVSSDTTSNATLHK